jgi:hypothetical protein
MAWEAFRAGIESDQLSSTVNAQFDEADDPELFALLSEFVSTTELTGVRAEAVLAPTLPEPQRIRVPVGARVLVGALITPDGYPIPDASLIVRPPGSTFLEASDSVLLHESSGGAIGAMQVLDPAPGEWTIEVDMANPETKYVVAFSTDAGSLAAGDSSSFVVAPARTTRWQCRLCRLAVLGLAAYLAWHVGAGLLAAGLISAAVIEAIVKALTSKSAPEVRAWIEGVIDGIGNSAKKWSLELCRLAGACS